MRIRTMPLKISEKSAEKAPGSSARSPSPRPPSKLGRGRGPECEQVDHYDEVSPPRAQDEVPLPREHGEVPPSGVNLDISFENVETVVSLEGDLEVHEQDQRLDLIDEKLTDTDNKEYKRFLSSMSPGQFVDLKAHYTEHNLKSTFVPELSGRICDGPGRPPPQDGQATASSRGHEERECNGDSFMVCCNAAGIPKYIVALMNDDQRMETTKMVVARTQKLVLKRIDQDPGCFFNANNVDETRRDITVPEASKYLVEFQKDHDKFPPIVEESGGAVRLLVKEDGAPISLRGDVWRALGQRGQLCLWTLREDHQKGNGSGSGRGGTSTEEGSKSSARQRTRITAAPEESAPTPSLPPSSLPGLMNMTPADLAVMLQQLNAQSDSMARAQDLQAKENARIMSSLGFLTASLGAEDDLNSTD